ncbi:MAG: 7-cyano-7-deazaguanine synthase QueC [Candidatus Omnitrophota bacterium]
MKNKNGRSRAKAVVLLSGGLDSATTLYYARARGFSCTCLSFDYGQRHRRELSAARLIAASAGCERRTVKIALPWKGSSLLDENMRLPAFNRRQRPGFQVPNTYVPARNIIFLSFALSCAEAIGARAIFIGANAVDYSGYPDCRPEFYKAFLNVVRTGTKSGKKQPVRILTPLLNMTKAEIVGLGTRLKAPLELTWSCYAGGSKPCGRCDSCFYRRKGFLEAGIDDPAFRGRHS